MLKKDIFALFARPEDFDAVRDKVEILGSMVLGLSQEVAALKGMLEKQGAWDDEAYREARKRVMVGDHSSAGAAPFTGYSWYRYTYDDEGFLKSVLGAGPEEIREFERDVEFVSSLS